MKIPTSRIKTQRIPRNKDAREILSALRDFRGRELNFAKKLKAVLDESLTIFAGKRRGRTRRHQKKNVWNGAQVAKALRHAPVLAFYSAVCSMAF